MQGDISDREAVFRVIQGADCVWHNAAAVGPYHPEEVYLKVNYEGTLHVIEACRRFKVPKIIFSSSPSTRSRPLLDLWLGFINLFPPSARSFLVLTLCPSSFSFVLLPRENNLLNSPPPLSARTHDALSAPSGSTAPTWMA